jgi:AbrB family looped-hinge helix DNA binding protein
VVVYDSFPSFHSKPSNNVSPKGYTGCAMSEHIIQISKITSNRQITIPVEIMKKLRVNAGDKIIWIERNGDIIVKKA